MEETDTQVAKLLLKMGLTVVLVVAVVHLNPLLLQALQVQEINLLYLPLKETMEVMVNILRVFLFAVAEVVEPVALVVMQQQLILVKVEMEQQIQYQDLLQL